MFLLLAFSFSCIADEWGKRVVVAENLQPVSKIAKQNHLPVLMFFAAEDCEFCDSLEADYLGSMSKSEEYKEKIIIRKVMIDNYDDVYDFSGTQMSADELKEQFNVRVTPTLLFVDYKGQRLAKKIVGYNRSGLFGAYLDQAIDEAKVKAQKI